MRKIIIIDDEYLVRLGLRSTIDWAGIDAEIIGEATNGLEGLELIRKLSPDIVISDVKMPLMSGVELVKALNETGYKGRIIILSGYRDFEYAKESFEHGISNYVLKPVNNDELLKTVENALAELEESRKNESLYLGLQTQIPTIQSQLINDILIGNVAIEEEIKAKLEMFGLPLIEEGTLALFKSDEQKRSGEAQEFFSSMIRDNKALSPFILHQNNLYLVIISGVKDPKTMQGILKAMLNEYNKLHDSSVSVMTGQFSGLSSLSPVYKQAQERLGQKLFIGLSTVEAINGPADLNSYKKSILAAMQIIADNFHKPISVAYVAESLNVSESHLMHLFKNSLGRTFNETLTMYRISKAKELLKTGKYRVNEVSDKVGFNDVKYFASVFRKFTGITPSDYQERGE